MSDASIVCTDLTFSWPDDTPVFRDLTFSLPPGRTGLVAPNGVGKTTLLNLLAGVYRPSSGTISVNGILGYLPQNLTFGTDLSVAEVLGVDGVIAALAAIEAGDADERHFAAIGTDWDVEERSRAQLERLGLGGIGLDRRLRTLSGGQIVTLGLAAQLLKSPDVLLLDEPTNNLDLDARNTLHGVLDGWAGCLVVVSHDRDLLDRMDRIAELEGSRISSYGGNFAAYEEQKRAEREVAEKNFRSAEQEVKREKRDMQVARERAARRSGTAVRNLKSAGLPKIVAGTLKRNAQESAAKADGRHGSRVEEARARLDDAGRALQEDDRLIIDLPGTVVPVGRTVFHGRGVQVEYGGRKIFAGDGFDLTIRGPERIALVGPNGAGKSTLLRAISGELATSGELQRADGRIASLSQRLDLLDVERSVAENLAKAAPNILSVDRMNLLARFLFRGPGAHLRVRDLSGGERLRATLACVLFAEPAPQLLLLDEPTNNLDLRGVEQLEAALRAYRGAMVVVSHDERFLQEIGVDRRLRLADGQVREVGDPGELPRPR
ncbi:ABC transporter ATP-binding protein [Nakamurella silvestris]|nr:ABC transporter ATP-binding protein [Nakamurella silvestris]